LARLLAKHYTQLIHMCLEYFDFQWVFLASLAFTLDCLPLKRKALQSFKTLETNFPTTLCHILEDLHLQQHCCEKHTCCSFDVFMG